MSACPPAGPGPRWSPPRPIACLQIDSRHPPLHRLRQSYEQGRRPYDPGLVLIVASDREIRRDRLRKLANWLGSGVIAALVIGVSLTLWHADDEGRIPVGLTPDASAVATAATPLPGFSERLEPNSPSAKLPDGGRTAPALRLDGALRQTGDRGY